MQTKNRSVVSRAEWMEARRRLLEKEKEFTRARDRLSEERRALPWVPVEEEYLFDRPGGTVNLGELFEGRSQLIVYHFMFAPDWSAGCKSCSFWADNFDPIVVHLNQRDVSLVAVSRAPLAKLQAFSKRLGWSFEWASSFGTNFNYDFGVSFTPDEVAAGRASYNFGNERIFGPEMPGISVFFKDSEGAVFHTYSCYARGLDMMNTAYQYLDLVPNGRDEAQLPNTMSWVRLHDEYGT